MSQTGERFPLYQAWLSAQVSYYWHNLSKEVQKKKHGKNEKLLNQRFNMYVKEILNMGIKINQTWPSLPVPGADRH